MHEAIYSLLSVQWDNYAEKKRWAEQKISDLNEELSNVLEALNGYEAVLTFLDGAMAAATTDAGGQPTQLQNGVQKDERPF